MMTQQDINQFKDIIETIEKDTSESVRFKKAFELCNLVFKTAKFDLVKLSENEDFALDSSIELDGISESINGLLYPLLNQIDKSLDEFKSSAKSNINNLEKLNKEYDKKQKEFKKLKETQKEYEKFEKELSQINLEIESYEKIDIEKIIQEIEIKTENLNKLKKEKESFISLWEKHLEENKNLDISNENIIQVSRDIEQYLRKMNKLIQDKIENDI